NLAAAARKSAKKRRSGSPRLAMACSPGTGKANESADTPFGCSRIFDVGPQKTEYASTHGISAAISATQLALSKTERKTKATAAAAPSFAKLARLSRPECWKTAAVTARARATATSWAMGARQNGST